MCDKHEFSGCVYDTVPCMHNCRGCHYGINECDVCGYLISHDDEYCGGCDKKVKKPWDTDE